MQRVRLILRRALTPQSSTVEGNGLICWSHSGLTVQTSTSNKTLMYCGVVLSGCSAEGNKNGAVYCHVLKADMDAVDDSDWTQDKGCVHSSTSSDEDVSYSTHNLASCLSTADRAASQVAVHDAGSLGSIQSWQCSVACRTSSIPSASAKKAAKENKTPCVTDGNIIAITVESDIGDAATIAITVEFDIGDAATTATTVESDIVDAATTAAIIDGSIIATTIESDNVDAATTAASAVAATTVAANTAASAAAATTVESDIRGI
jgi:hypothetical protein